MSQLSKNQLKAENQSQFPNNNVGAITPSHLRAFNVDMIDSTVNQTDFTSFSGSVASEINDLEAFSSSLATNFVSSASFSTFSQSVDDRLDDLEAFSSSLDTNFVTEAELAAATGSLIETASLSGGTLTFTKGDSSTFDLNLPTASITASYGSFSYSGSIALTSSVSQLLPFDTIEYASLISLSGSSGIVVTEPGIYDFDLYTQMTGQGNSVSDLFWVTKNGNNVTNSTLINNAGTAGTTIRGGNQRVWQLQADAGDTFQFYVQHNASNGRITGSIAGGTYPLYNTLGEAIPAGPSILLNVNRVDVGGLSSGSYTNIQALNQYTASNDQKWNTLGSQTGSFITESESGSFLITGSVAGNVLTFTKGDNTTFNLTVDTGSGGGGGSIDTGSLVTTASFNAYTQSNDARVGSLEAATASYVTETESGSFLITASFASQTLTFTKGDNTTFSFIIPDVSGSTIDTASFATTGSNTFRGNETFEDGGGNASTLVPTSGSLMLVAKTYTSASAHLSASAGNFVNIIFKNNNNTPDTIISGSNNIFTNPSAATAGFKRFVGTGNIYQDPGTVPQISGSMAFPLTMNYNNNSYYTIMRGPVSSSTWTMNYNSGNGALNIGPSATNHAKGMVSGLQLSQNIINGTLQVRAHGADLKNQTQVNNNTQLGATITNIIQTNSAAAFSNNLIFGGSDGATAITITSYSGSTGTGSVSILNNAIQGGLNVITISGQYSGSYVPFILSSGMFGGYNDFIIDAGLHRGIGQSYLIGNELSMKGTTLSPDPLDEWGSVFVGRYNVVDGVRDTSRENIFVVGTGNANGTKNGLLIDSGSNMFVEGTFNMSGSSNFNGNVIITGSLTASLADGYMYVGNGSGITTAIPTSSLSIATASLATNALDIVVDVKNTTGVQINKGTVVRIIGAVGDNPLIGTASWEDDNNSANTLGFVVADIANDAFGRVMTQGTLLAVDTDPALGYAAGDLVYLSSSGQYTNVKPPAPYHEVRLGQVLRAQQNNGSIYVLIQNGYELEELHNVDINTGSLANKDILAYDSASTQWENWSISELGLATTGSNGFVGTETISGSLIITGSARGNVQALTISSNTASIDFSAANYFTITLPETASTHFTATGVQPGLSAMLVITTAANASASFSSTFLQPSGSGYVPTAGASKKDVLSFLSTDTTNVFVVATKNMV